MTPDSSLEKLDVAITEKQAGSDLDLTSAAPVLAGASTAGAALNGDGDGDRDGEDGPATEERLEETKRIMRKIDIRLLPLCAALYLSSFVDRTAVGNAKVAGMNAELHLTPSEYAIALSLFFVPYGLLEPFYTLAIKRWGARPVLSLAVVAWGVVIGLTSVVQNAAGLIATRIFLGITEAGLTPGVTLLLSFIYPRRFIAFRLGLFLSASTLAGAFGGLFSYALSHVNAGGYSGWRWLFIVLGLLTVGLGVLSWFGLISSVDEAKFLSADEKAYLKDRLRYDGTDVPMNDEFAWKFVRAGVLDWKPYVGLLTLIGILGGMYSVALCLPTILHVKLGYSAVNANLYTVPVYTVAAAATLAVSWLSDRFQNRAYFIMAGGTVSLAGWALGYASHSARVQYAACFISAMGSFSASAPHVAQLAQNVGGKTKRAVCLGMQGTIGGMAGIISSNIFLSSEAPNYATAYKVCIGLQFSCLTGATAMMLLLRAANARKRRMIQSGEAARLSRQQLADMGDRSPYFEYKW